MSFIDVVQHRTQTVNDLDQTVSYGVQTQVIRAVGIDLDLFVYRVNDKSFNHVATLYDLLKWPVGYDVAAARNIDFYRQSVVNVSYANASTAQDAASSHIQRLKLVQKDWDSQPTDFPGDSHLTIGTP